MLLTACSKSKNDPIPEKYDPAKPPEITDFTPKAGKVYTEITINGKNFNPEADKNYITIGASFGAKIKSASVTKLVFELPPSAATGKIECMAITTNLSAVSSSDFTLMSSWTRQNVSFPGTVRTGQISFHFPLELYKISIFLEMSL
ncbi:IPT/TIG domain-containing protein [Cytophagaceae bacterium DM2B3-1]|uniref:IPT/TIG domain-containing protein n=1 Tax=Xanthocytophaga flava TaxID=3048013 RepID=A0ABT7CV38_9BACT|nr:IPT/TIG domain-containing protein [Xanthocytophaga flavus]MDJ1497641.1 IPT/TIG domain-containing protein [Xanthocytophaga flavus]